MHTTRLWSRTRKQLEEEFLCESLQGRVRYYSTRYHKAHNGPGRVCILVDGEEKLVMNRRSRVPAGEDNGGRRARDMHYISEKEFQAKFKPHGIFAPGDFGSALDEYFANGIDKSLQSENLLVRLLAILDRRVGKRTLDKIKPTLDTLPPWLRYFYELRLESEITKKVGASVPASPCPGGTKCG